jgi:hypothetical protein
MNKAMFKIMFWIGVEQIENNEGFTFIILLWGLNSMKFLYANCSKDLIENLYSITSKLQVNHNIWMKNE